MTVPGFMFPLLGWRGQVPNVADSDSTTSIAIASHIYASLGINAATTLAGGQAGRLLEEGVRDFLAAGLPGLDASRQWTVERRKRVSDFTQYAHLRSLQNLIDRDTTGTLSTEIGSDYLIKPDVTVGIRSPRGLFLHAALPCKWTIRSDRVQNIRHEGVILTRHRRGRQPHIVTVTPEPLPTRLASIARGTGEVDAVYHVLFDELVTATHAAGTTKQIGALDELVTQRRLLPFVELLPTIVL